MHLWEANALAFDIIAYLLLCFIAVAFISCMYINKAFLVVTCNTAHEHWVVGVSGSTALHTEFCCCLPGLYHSFKNPTAWHEQQTVVSDNLVYKTAWHV